MVKGVRSSNRILEFRSAWQYNNRSAPSVRHFAGCSLQLFADRSGIVVRRGNKCSRMLPSRRQTPLLARFRKRATVRSGLQRRRSLPPVPGFAPSHQRSHYFSGDLRPCALVPRSHRRCFSSRDGSAIRQPLFRPLSPQTRSPLLSFVRLTDFVG